MFKIGDRIIDAGFKGTVVGIISPKKTRVLYDSHLGRLEVTVSNIFLAKIKPTTKFPKLTYWK